MKKRYIIFLSVISILFMGNVKASTYGYYVNSDGIYQLCTDSISDCISVSFGQSGTEFQLSSKKIIYNSTVYTYNESFQTAYNNTQQGVSSMYYYMNGSDTYVLCKNANSCHSYSSSKLATYDVTISAEKSITINTKSTLGEAGEVYYYSVAKSTTTSGSTSTAAATTDYCTRLAEPLKFIGNIVLIGKIALALIIIILGMVDFGKAITGGKDEEVKKSAVTFGRRIAAGVAVFLIPTIVSVIFSLVSDWVKIEGDFNACQKCVLWVSKCKTASTSSTSTSKTESYRMIDGGQK